MFLYSSNPISKGARLLSAELGIKRIKHFNSRFSGHRNPYVINWGATAIDLPWKERVRFLNAPKAVQRVSNKLIFFNDMDGEEWLPPWTDDWQLAEVWNEHHKIVERHVLQGHGGVGIRIVEKDGQVLEAPLYVQYIPKRAEYRVHIFKTNEGIPYVIDIQQKVKPEGGQEPLNWQIRSHGNGFIYIRENIEPIRQCVRNVAIQAMSVTDLHFGAVDVIYNSRQDQAYVLEINTAPGLEGQTVISYADAFKEFTGE